MASIVKLRTGKQPLRAIDFTGLDGRRKRVRIGKVTRDDALAAKRGIERLLISSLHGQDIDSETAKWLAGLSDEIHDRISRHGLCERRKRDEDITPTTLASFIDSYIVSRTIKKDNTRRNYVTTRNHLVGYFGTDRLIADITPGDADEFRHALLRDHSDATVSREIKRARQYFQAAVRKKIITENPFADAPTPAQVNRSREYFVSQDEITKVIEACPDAQWRLIAALSRYGGLRCPSEHLALQWGGVDWEKNRVTVRSPKTEHHEGGESRVMPLFPELRPYLEAVFDEAEPGTKYVITRYRQANANLRTQLLRIIGYAGLNPWTKLFQNMRASRETELTERFPIHVVCAWLGNSTTVATKHYLQVTDDHFKRAAECAAESAAESAAQAQQKAQQQDTAPNSKESQDIKKARENRAECVPVQQAASSCDKHEYPLGESNPCLRTENPMSWATRRRGRCQDQRPIIPETSQLCQRPSTPLGSSQFA